MSSKGSRDAIPGARHTISSSTNPLLGQHDPQARAMSAHSQRVGLALASLVGIGDNLTPGLGGVRSHFPPNNTPLTVSNVNKFANVTMRSRDDSIGSQSFASSSSTISMNPTPASSRKYEEAMPHKSIDNSLSSSSKKLHSSNGQSSTNYAFKKSLTMGSLSRIQDSPSSINGSRVDNASNTNNNFSGLFAEYSESSVTFENTLRPSHSMTSGMSPLLSEDVVGHYLSELYKCIAGGATMSDRELCEAVSTLQSQPETKTMRSEIGYVEKLKMHLITQDRQSEAKRFVHLHEKLKGMPHLKNREALFTLMYQLFDKEKTRLAIQAKKLSRESGANSNKNDSPDEFEPISMPSLNYKADRVMSAEIRQSRNRLPSLGLGHSDKKIEKLAHRSNNMEKVLHEQQGRPTTAIAFPKDHGRNLLSQNSMIQSTSSAYSRNTLQLNNSESKAQHGVGMLTGYRQLEKELIKDLIYVFQGIDGSLIKTDARGNFEVSAKKTIHPGLRHQTLRLAELGFFYKQIRAYCDKPIVGLMAQGLKHALEKEIQEYYRLLAIVQAKVQQIVVDTPMSEQFCTTGEEMTILKLTVWMYDIRPRLDALAGIISSCEGSKGGSMCSILYKYSLHGDPMIGSITNSLLSSTAKPMYLMLCQWILYGELEDPCGEFFIAADVSCKKERLWHSKYHIRDEMLPSFISVKQAERILATGKNINFLKEICQHSLGYEGRGQIKSLLERSPVDCMFTEDDKVLNPAIEKAYKTTSKMVLDVIIQESKLIDHLKAIKRYLLLGQGDFIQHLMELIQEELSKPASKLYAHNISAILESAVRATNAQFETEDILSRLDTRILLNSDKDLGWDVFCLDYKVHGSIGTVLTEDVMIRYNQLFNALWRIKRIEMILNTLWKDQTALFKCQRVIPELGPVLHRSQLLISEMIHFVHQTQYYIMFEATECAWDRLMEEVNKAVDLDEVIQAHKKFMEAITSRSLLDRENRELLNQLRGIFDSVHELKAFLDEFETRVGTELQFRKSLDPGSQQQEEAQKKFFASYIRQAKGKIETLYTTTQDLVRSFLLVLNRQPDLTLQCLSFRLDFNEYYNSKDARLSQPLTFQHRRMSSNAFDPTNRSTSGIMDESVYNSSVISESFYED